MENTLNKKYILTKNPYWSGPSRVGWEVEVIDLLDEYNKPYKAFKDKLGVTWPYSEWEIT